MGSKVRIVTLIVVPVALLVTLVFGTFLTISPAHTVHATAITHTAPTNCSPSNRCYCSRGSSCNNLPPEDYYSTKNGVQGNCDDESSAQGNASIVESNGLMVGILVLYYVNTCDIWFEDAFLGQADTLEFIVSNQQKVYQRIFSAAANVFYNSYTLYDSSCSCTVFASAGANSAHASGITQSG